MKIHWQFMLQYLMNKTLTRVKDCSPFIHDILTPDRFRDAVVVSSLCYPDFITSLGNINRSVHNREI